jgi:D-tyrosyl-tRNA(Tyr) deacylase
MRILLQRVARAGVHVEGRPLGQIDQGLFLLVGIGAEDEADGGAALEPMARKVLGLRIFADEEHRMNRSVEEIGGGLLAVSQFTLHADCRKGRRPGFTGAARPEAARAMFDRFVALLRVSGLRVETGEFGAMMAIELVNDGPVTIWLDSAEVVK